MNLTTIGRVPLSNPGPLVSPYKKDESALISRAENFTISINTISRQLYTKYRDDYKAGQYDNNYFALMSQMGLGNQEKPVLKAHYLEHINNIDQDLTTIWAENVSVIEDFQKDKKSEKLYLSFSSFCQGLGKSTLQQVTDSLNDVFGNVGAAFPSLVPYTALGEVALEGINNIVKTVLDPLFKSQVKTSTFGLYPIEQNLPPVIGKAPLQTGVYAFFFEPVELSKLRIEEEGIITSSDNQPVSPYIVVNIEKGINLAPGQIEQTLATEVLHTYTHNYGYPLTSSNQIGNYFNALEELGKSMRLSVSTQRFFELKNKGDNLTQAEKDRLNILRSYLEENLVGFKNIINS